MSTATQGFHVGHTDERADLLPDGSRAVSEIAHARTAPPPRFDGYADRIGGIGLNDRARHRLSGRIRTRE